MTDINRLAYALVIFCIAAGLWVWAVETLADSIDPGPRARLGLPIAIVVTSAAATGGMYLSMREPIVPTVLWVVMTAFGLMFGYVLRTGGRIVTTA